MSTYLWEYLDYQTKQWVPYRIDGCIQQLETAFQQNTTQTCRFELNPFNDSLIHQFTLSNHNPSAHKHGQHLSGNQEFYDIRRIAIPHQSYQSYSQPYLSHTTNATQNTAFYTPLKPLISEAPNCGMISQSQQSMSQSQPSMMSETPTFRMMPRSQQTTMSQSQPEPSREDIVDLIYQSFPLPPSPKQLIDPHIFAHITTQNIIEQLLSRLSQHNCQLLNNYDAITAIWKNSNISGRDLAFNLRETPAGLYIYKQLNGRKLIKDLGSVKQLWRAFLHIQQQFITEAQRQQLLSSYQPSTQPMKNDHDIYESKHQSSGHTSPFGLMSAGSVPSQFAAQQSQSFQSPQLINWKAPKSNEQTMVDEYVLLLQSVVTNRDNRYASGLDKLMRVVTPTQLAILLQIRDRYYLEYYDNSTEANKGNNANQKKTISVSPKRILKFLFQKQFEIEMNDGFVEAFDWYVLRVMGQFKFGSEGKARHDNTAAIQCWIFAFLRFIKDEFRNESNDARHINLGLMISKTFTDKIIITKYDQFIEQTNNLCNSIRNDPNGLKRYENEPISSLKSCFLVNGQTLGSFMTQFEPKLEDRSVMQWKSEWQQYPQCWSAVNFDVYSRFNSVKDKTRLGQSEDILLTAHKYPKTPNSKTGKVELHLWYKGSSFRFFPDDLSNPKFFRRLFSFDADTDRVTDSTYFAVGQNVIERALRADLKWSTVDVRSTDKEYTAMHDKLHDSCLRQFPKNKSV